MASDPSRFRFCIDRGGTFTDVYAEVPTDGSVDDPTPRVIKLLSEDPANYPNAPREGIRRVLEEATGVAHPREVQLDASRIEWIRMGTTVATNALLEREGEQFALVTTRGFGDALEIGNQARPEIFDVRVRKARPLYACTLEANERVRVLRRGGCAGAADEAASLGLDTDAPEGATATISGGSDGADRKFVMGSSGEWVEILRDLHLDSLRAQLAHVRARGIAGCLFCHFTRLPPPPDVTLPILSDMSRGMAFSSRSGGDRADACVRVPCARASGGGTRARDGLHAGVGVPTPPSAPPPYTSPPYTSLPLHPRWIWRRCV
mgnify:CR=1 FL=1